MIVLTAYVSLLPDHVDAAITACRTVRAASLTEPGCERYDFFQSPDDATKLVFVEEWTTRADLDTHFEQAAFNDFFAEMGNYMSNPPDLRIFDATLMD
jgi:quinol monooxygenase YgiN